MRILLAEDNLVNRAVATGILETQGHTLVHAANGREAFDACKSAAFDLIFMDIQMPEMDGFEATRLIHEMETASGAHTPIAAMTAHAIAGDRDRCLRAGMDDYISKPLRKEDILRVLASVSKSSSSSIPSSDLRTRTKDEDDSGALLIMTREQLLEELDGDEELFAKLIALFHENTPQILNAIRTAVERRDASALEVGAHRLRGSIGALGAGRAGELAAQLEKQGKLAEFDGAQDRLEKLEREINHIHAALADYTDAIAVA